MARKSMEAQRAYQRAYYQRRKAEQRARAGDASGPCCYCGETSDSLTIEHIRPRSRGGGDDAENLRFACRWCNMSRGHRGIEEWRAAIARRIAGIPAFTPGQREYLLQSHGLDVYYVSAAQLGRVVFAFESTSGASTWKSEITTTSPRD